MGGTVMYIHLYAGKTQKFEQIARIIARECIPINFNDSSQRSFYCEYFSSLAHAEVSEYIEYSLAEVQLCSTSPKYLYQKR